MALVAPFWSDVRYGVRALGRDKGFTATALVIFALCLGANVALFAIVNAVLLRPLPFAHPDRLVTVYNSYPKAGLDRAGCSVPHYLERRAGIAAFAESAALRDSGVTLRDGGSPQQVEAMSVTPSFFRTLGVSAALGRTFTDAEAERGRNNVLILSDALWRDKFGGDPGVIGRTVRIDGGTSATVIGVMPRGFRYLSSNAQLYTPLVFSDDDRRPEARHGNNINMIARLRPGVSIAAAQAQVDGLNHATAAVDPYAKLVAQAGFNTKVAGLHEDEVARTRPMVLLLQAGVLLMLGIGLVNLTNLLLVRATGRAKERSVRQVLGASGAQLARQIVAETVILALCGGVLGLAVGWTGLRFVAALGVNQLPHSGEIGIDSTVCLVALAASVVVGLLLALPIVWHLHRWNLAAALSVESRGGTASRGTHRLRHTLIAAQFALAFVLLVSAVLLGLSFARVLAVNPGFEAEHALTAAIPLPPSKYTDDRQRVAFVERLGRELQGAPGVTAVGFGSALPFTGNTDINGVTVEGHTAAPGDSLKSHYMAGVTGDYFAALRIPLREGRLITGDDTARDAKVCVVDETVARFYWPNESAIGHRLYNGVPQDGNPPFTVVGVVGTIKQSDLADQQGHGAIYLPFSSYVTRTIDLGVRTSLAPAALTATVRAALARVDPDLPLDDVKPLSLRISDSLEQRRSPLYLAGIFSALALVLVTVGLYGVLAYAVSQRRREIGLRMALGAQPGHIRAQFLGLGARLALAGTVIGGSGAWWSGRAMTTLLFGVNAWQPWVFAGAVATLTLIALIACFLPAARAARVAPMEALRGD